MKVPYDEAVSLIQDAIKSARSDDQYAIDGESGFKFMKGYIKALADFDLITHQQSQILRKELLNIPVR